MKRAGRKLAGNQVRGRIGIAQTINIGAPVEPCDDLVRIAG
jgi:hypothetical protein